MTEFDDQILLADVPQEYHAKIRFAHERGYTQGKRGTEHKVRDAVTAILDLAGIDLG